MFTEILIKNLHAPASARTWEHLVGTNRILNTTCYRHTVWDLATTAMRVSPAVHASWVVEAEALSRLASTPSFKV